MARPTAREILLDAKDLLRCLREDFLLELTEYSQYSIEYMDELYRLRSLAGAGLADLGTDDEEIARLTRRIHVRHGIELVQSVRSRLGDRDTLQTCGNIESFSKDHEIPIEEFLVTNEELKSFKRQAALNEAKYCMHHVRQNYHLKEHVERTQRLLRQYKISPSEVGTTHGELRRILVALRKV